jgi:hypothetical protein
MHTIGIGTRRSEERQGSAVQRRAVPGRGVQRPPA